MATTDYDFNLTRNQIIERAFRIVGALSPGDTLSGEMLVQGNLALNSLVKSWQSRRVFLWQLVQKTQALSAATASYTLGNEIISVDRAYYTQNNNDVPVEVLSWRKYHDIRDKTSSGNPSIVTIDQQISTSTMYVWPVPTASLTLTYLAVVRLQDMDTASGNADIPQKFVNALVYGLADDLSDEYGLNLGERNRISQKYERFFDDAARSDVVNQDTEHVDPSFIFKGRR